MCVCAHTVCRIYTSLDTLLGTPVQLLGNKLPITWQQLNAFRHLDVVKTTCWSSNRASELGKKEGFKWLWTWNGCWFQTGWIWVFHKLLILLVFSHKTISRVYREWSEKEKISSERQLCGWKCLVDVRGQRRMGRLDRDDRKATVTQITTRYNQGMQNTISEHTTHRTLKQMGYSSRRPHRVPLLSANIRKRRLQFTQDHQN